MIGPQRKFFDYFFANTEDCAVFPARLLAGRLLRHYLKIDPAKYHDNFPASF